MHGEAAPYHPRSGVGTYLFDFAIFLQNLPTSSLEENKRRKQCPHLQEAPVSLGGGGSLITHDLHVITGLGTISLRVALRGADLSTEEGQAGGRKLDLGQSAGAQPQGQASTVGGGKE